MLWRPQGVRALPALREEDPVKKSLRLLAGFVALAGLACTTTYTDADIEAEELRQDREAASEEKRDREIGEEGGANVQAIDEEIQQVD
jgi:hypothetical protein